MKEDLNLPRSNFGSNDFVRVFAFDFSTAFDSVVHHIVCNKLKLKSLDVNPHVLTRE